MNVSGIVSRISKCLAHPRQEVAGYRGEGG